MGWIKEIMELFGFTHEHAWAAAAGTLLCIGLMQAIKRWLPDRNSVRIIVAFGVAAFATYTLSPPMGVTFHWTSLWLGIIIGLWSPSIFKVVKVIGRKRNWAWVNAL